jgi:FAD/FMN-containing dehydrogenase
MPYKRKDSNLWYAIYTDASGQRTRRSTGTSNKKEAQEIEAKWRMEVRRERVFGEKPALTFEAMMVAYLKQCQSERERYATKALLGHFAGRTMDRLGPQDIHGYKAARTRQGIAKATVNRELNVLCAAINHANTELGHTLPNPVTGRKYDGIEHRVRWLTTAEAQRLITAAEASRTAYLADFIHDVERIFAHHHLVAAIYGHAGSGNLHLRPLFDVTDPGLPVLIQRVADEVYECVLRYDGTITAEHGMGRLRTRYLPREWGSAITGYMRQVKAIFDPDDLLNPEVMFSNRAITGDMKPLT